MFYEPTVVKGLCKIFRVDVLRLFILGLKRSLANVLFAAKAKNLLSAPALA